MVADTRPSTSSVLASALRNSGLRRAIAAFFLFHAAEWATWIAILVWAFGRGGATDAGLIALAQLVPAAIVAPFGSVLGDRMPRNRALTLGYSLQSLAMLATGIALAMMASAWLIALLAAAAASAITLTRPVHNAVLPDLARGPEELTAANSATSVAYAFASFVGPAVSGILLVVWGPGSVYLAMGLVMMIAATLVVGANLQRVSLRIRDEHLLTSAAAGFAAIRGDVPAALLVLMVGAQFVVMGLMDIFVVVLALDILQTGQSGPSALTSALGLGGIAGAAFTVVLVGRRRMTPALVVGVLGVGVPIALVGLATSLWMALGLIAVYGAGNAFFDVGARTLLQRTVPADLLSRIFGIQEGLMMVGLAIGAVLAPLLVNAFGARAAFVAAGTFLPIVGLLASTQIRKLDGRAVLPGPAFFLLRRLPIFAPLPQRTLEQLSASVVDVGLGAGITVISEGDIGDRFYFVECGDLVVTQRGNELRHLHAGDQFGEIALLRDIPRTATVTTTTPTRLLVLERADFLGALTGFAPARAAAESIASRHLLDDEDHSDDVEYN